jgi:histidinol-phosphate aminotransferase
LELAPYKPILPLEVLSEQLGIEIEKIVKLDANENPYGPPEDVYEALATLQYPHIYPDPESRRLRKKLSDDCGVPMENILVGCGADELIDLLLRVVLEPDDVIINTPPTFGMYAFDCSINAGKVVDVPRMEAPSFGLDIPGIKSAVEKHKPKVLFLTSPNNPDGSVITTDEIDDLLQLQVLVVVDEAYVEFCDTSGSKIADVVNHENLIVLRTFSKRAALAGLRVGYGAFPSWLVSYLWRVKQPYNVSVAAEVAACAALDNPDYLKRVKDLIITERKRLFNELQQFSFLTPFPSHSNFILTRVAGDAMGLKEFLASQGVMVRYYSSPEQLASCIRISVGKPEQTDVLVAAIKAYEATQM